MPRLHDEVDEEEAELARKVMEVSPKPSSEGSRSYIKDELKESLRSENFFLNKMDSTGANSNAKDEPSFQKTNNKILIEIGEPDNAPNHRAAESALIGTISPLSGASSDFGIQRGGMSLESSTSGENREKLSMIISEIAQDANNALSEEHKTSQQVLTTTLNKEQAEYAEALSNEIL